MIKKTGAALITILILIVGLAAVTGVLEQVWPAAQPSPTAQQLIAPTKPVNTFPMTTLGKLKNKKQRLDVIAATTAIVRNEFELKIAKSQSAYAAIAAVAAAYFMSIYKNKTMYSEQEVAEIRNGNTNSSV